jgi:uncharacterized protein (DUF1501 family)
MIPHAVRSESIARNPGRKSALTRREVIQIGYSTALGTGLAGLAGRRALAAGQARMQTPSTPRAKSVLFLFLFGGPSHLDTFDPKPDAPAEFRGDFATVGTPVSGLRICEHLPQIAQRMDRLALVRSMTCNPSFGDHRMAVHGLLGGIDELPAGATLAASRRDWPCWCAGVEYARTGSDGLPSGVVLPGEVVDPGTGLYPGQNAGLLGAKFDPYRIKANPADAKYRVDESLRLAPGMTVERLASKQTLLAELNRQQSAMAKAIDAAPYQNCQREAFGVLTNGRLAKALAVDDESDTVRERYGRHQFGQTILLARRLIEAGVPIVQANVGYHALWDTHYNNFEALRGLLPHLDRGVSALLDDMQASGLLDETLVVIRGSLAALPNWPNQMAHLLISPVQDATTG